MSRFLFILYNIMSLIKRLSEIPIKVKHISISLFLCMVGLGIWDTFFSVYIESATWLEIAVSIFWALYSITKLSSVLATGVLNDKWKTDKLIILWKVLRVFAWIFYFLWWLFAPRIFITLGVIFSWFAWSIIFPTYRSVYNQTWEKNKHGQIFWLYFSSINLAYLTAAIICIFAILFIELHEIYLFMILFMVLSLIRDDGIWRFRKDKIRHPLNFFSKKDGIVPLFIKHIFSLAPLKKIFKTIKLYWDEMYNTLWAQSLVGLMEQVGFLFIPIIAIENNFSLSQVAILSTIMGIPNFLNTVAWYRWDQYNKKLIIWILLFIAWFFYIFLGKSSWFASIIIITFLIALIIALLSPLESALISESIKKNHGGTFWWVQEFIWTCWEILGSLGFWILISLIWIQSAFTFFGIGLTLLGLYIIIKKLFFKKSWIH